ncbi:MAG TPA: amidohydrolase family protein [Afipia sp.]
MVPIFDSEVHPWVRVARGWHYLEEGETRPDPSVPEFKRFFWPASQRPGEEDIGHPPDLSDEYIDAMGKLGITAGLIMAGAHVCDNDSVAQIVARHPERLKGLAYFGRYMPPFVSPTHRQAAFDELEHGLRDLSLLGIGEVWCGEWWPHSQEAALKDMHEVFSLCNHYKGAPLLIHAGRNCAGDFAGSVSNEPEWDYADPLILDSIAKEFPAVPIVLCHMGKKDRELFDRCVEFARRHSQVFFNTSFTISEFVTDAVNKIGADRIIFGTDWYPFEANQKDTDVYHHRKQIRVVDEAEISDQDKEKIFWRNLDHLIGMPAGKQP